MLSTRSSLLPASRKPSQFRNSCVSVTNASAPQQDVVNIDDTVRIGPSALEFPYHPADRLLDRLFNTSNRRSMFDIRLPSLFPSWGRDNTNFFDRIPPFPRQDPFVSHPREVREIPIEVKDGNESSSNPRLSPIIVDVTDTEHDHGPEIHGTVTMDDDDSASENDMPSQPTQVHYAADNDLPAQTEFLDDDIDEQILREALEASMHDAQEQHSAKGFDSEMVMGDPVAMPGLNQKEDQDLAYAMSLSLREKEMHSHLEDDTLEHGAYNSTATGEVPKCSTVQGSQLSSEHGWSLIEDTEDAEDHPLVRQKTKSSSPGFTEGPKEQEKKIVYPSMARQSVSISRPHEELDIQFSTRESSQQQEPLTDENNVINILLRMPDGRRISHRFLKSDKLEAVFDFIAIAGGVHPEKYRLARSYPRRTFSYADGARTLEEIGLTSKQEALYLEPV
uniref:UBX domain-containing protein n=1 Tax=Kalanchoe fedtschenkoi TaxID=63787 RepID=A0A7N0SYW1_KALFE